MVEINIVGFHLIQFTSGNQGFYKQGVELVCRIEIIGLALIGSIWDVFLCQFLDGSEDGIRAACAQGRMIREMAHQLWRYIFHAWAATEINAHQRTDYLAELISDDTAASLTQCWVDNGWKHGVKFLHDWKNSSKRCEFFEFYLYLCSALLRFSLVF